MIVHNRYYILNKEAGEGRNGYRCVANRLYSINFPNAL